MALINRSEHVYWELVPLKGTQRWRSFIRNACRVGLLMILFVQVFQKGGSSSQVLKKGKVLKKGNNKGRKKGILRVSRHLKVMLSMVLLMWEKETQR
jgi:hypothetical protein